jgi:hypothetical protein
LQLVVAAHTRSEQPLPDISALSSLTYLIALKTGANQLISMEMQYCVTISLPTEIAMPPILHSSQ